MIKILNTFPAITLFFKEMSISRHSLFLKDIFEHSIQTEKLPYEWVEANVARAVFKKGDRQTASNFNPKSLTCVCAKLLKHII